MEYKAFADSTAFIDTNDAEFLAISATAAQARDAGAFGDKPLVVLTALDHGSESQQWRALQAELVPLSSNSTQRLVAGATHASILVNQDDSQTTVAAILDVVTAVRTGRPLVR